MTNYEGKKHFQIPNNEVKDNKIIRKPRPKPKENFNHISHAVKLSSGIENIRKNKKDHKYIKSDFSVFKVVMDEGKQVERRGDYQKIFDSNGLKVNALITNNEAIVSADSKALNKLESKINSYKTKSTNRPLWDYVDSIDILSTEDKISAQIQKEIDELKVERNIDVEILVAPVFRNDADGRNVQQEVESKLRKYNITQPEEEPVVLDDNSVSMHFYIPSSAIRDFASENFILEIESAEYLGPSESHDDNSVDIDQVVLDPNVQLDDLPVVTVMDDGIKFPDNLDPVVKGTYPAKPNDNLYVDSTIKEFAEHGTKVASRLVFGENLIEQSRQKVFIPHVQVIDARIATGKVNATSLIKRIKQTVEDLHEVSKIFLFSYNTDQRFDKKNISKLGAELDALTIKYGVVFIVPTGNHELYKQVSDHSMIVADDRSKISAPADSFFATSVASVSNRNNDISSSFSRVGAGFNESLKPGLSYPGGDTEVEANGTVSNYGVEVISNEGKIVWDLGTSFAAPLAAKDTAILYLHILEKYGSIFPQNDRTRISVFMAKALLYHRANKATDFVFNSEVGFGNADLNKVENSFLNDATYMRYGKLRRQHKQKLLFHVPEIIEKNQTRGKEVVRLVTTVISFSTANRLSGTDYLDGYVSTSLHGLNGSGNDTTLNPAHMSGRSKWYNIHHTSVPIKTLTSGDWTLDLEYFSKPTVKDEKEIEYIALITLESEDDNQMDIYSEIQAQNRFNIINSVQIDATFEEGES